MRAATSMQIIEGLTDAEIAEAHRSADVFAEVQEMTAPLNAFLSLIHAIDWLDVKAKADKAALRAFFDGQFGDPVQIALGTAPVANGRPEATRFSELLASARELATEERYLNWQVAFPGVWSNWEFRSSIARLRLEQFQKDNGLDRTATLDGQTMVALFGNIGTSQGSSMPPTTNQGAPGR